MSTTRTSNNKKAIIATVIAVAVLGSIAAFSFNASQAFAQQQTNSTNTTNGGKQGNPNAEKLIRQYIIKHDRQEQGLRWHGLTTQSYSLVAGIKVLGVVEKSPETVSITLAHMTPASNNTEARIDSSPVSQNITILSVASHSDANPNTHLDGSTVVPSGWSGTTTIDLNLAGTHSLFDYHFIKTIVAQDTGQSLR